MSAPTPNDLGRVITSDRVRQIIYTAYVVAVVLLGAVQAAYAGSEAGAPSSKLPVLDFRDDPEGVR